MTCCSIHSSAKPKTVLVHFKIPCRTDNRWFNYGTS